MLPWLEGIAKAATLQNAKAFKEKRLTTDYKD
jgi:hypothetical protein